MRCAVRIAPGGGIGSNYLIFSLSFTRSVSSTLARSLARSLPPSLTTHTHTHTRPLWEKRTVKRTVQKSPPRANGRRRACGLLAAPTWRSESRPARGNCVCPVGRLVRARRRRRRSSGDSDAGAPRPHGDLGSVSRGRLRVLLVSPGVQVRPDGELAPDFAVRAPAPAISAIAGLAPGHW